MSFSTTLLLHDVDDYITPSKVCIRPVKIGKVLGTTSSIRVEDDGSYSAISEDGARRALPNATISLNDCLACSGCITTAESVLISVHSVETFFQFLHRNRNQFESPAILAVSISPQSICSIASELTNTQTTTNVTRWFDCWSAVNQTQSVHSSVARTRRFLAEVFHGLGAHIVLDTTFARDISLTESAAEFTERFRQPSDGGQLPVFCSTCPGWVCFAEKTSSSSRRTANKAFSIIPHLSSVRSPQQICGRLLKQCDPQHIYHVSVMPCFDKKLEATRPEFKTSLPILDGQSSPDVDLVLATNEVMEVLNAVCPDSDYAPHRELLLASPPGLPPELQHQVNRLNKLFCTDDPSDSNQAPLYRHLGTGSGGYAHFVFRSAAQNLFHLSLNCNLTDDPHVLIRQLTNRDFQEWLLFQTEKDRDTSQAKLAQLDGCHTPYRQTGLQPAPLLVFAVANGFRNIQNIIQSLKSTRRQSVLRTQRQDSMLRLPERSFDYVEVMACPSGCLNGGGQLKNTSDATRDAYFELPVIGPEFAVIVDRLYSYIDEFDPQHHSLHTTYREVPPMEVVNPTALQW